MRLEGFIEKGWGSEFIWVTNDLYCGKFLKFNEGSQFSMHFHAKKHESWYILEGEFKINWIDTLIAKTHQHTLREGDTWVIEPLTPHQVICVKAGTIIEISTADSVEDNYRVIPGDSQ
jgi:mannose-6-phosphate isomerase-like protein (cupin superfamily)